MYKDLVNPGPINVSLRGNILSISYDHAYRGKSDSIEIDIGTAPPDARRNTGVYVASSLQYRIVAIEELPNSKNQLVIYTNSSEVVYYVHTKLATHPLTRLMTVKSKVFWLRLSGRGLGLRYVCAVDNPYNLPITATYLSIAGDVKIKKDYPVFCSLPSSLRLLKDCRFSDYIKIDQLLDEEPTINEPIAVIIDVAGIGAIHSLSKGSKLLPSSKWYYAPIARARRGEYSLSIRRGAHGNLVLVRRLLEPIEKTARFHFYESTFVSMVMYNLAHFFRAISRSKMNIYFEKNANQAEEGAIDIFRSIRDNDKKSKNFFILNEWSPAYTKLAHEVGVVKNFTLKSYWILYRANNVIATEVPQHANILRSSSKYVRRAPYTQTFVFLQHGITYLKAQDKNTSFLKGREGEPDYMVVGSKKEQMVVADMLNIGEHRLLNVGLPIYDKIPYGHITNKSDNIITIMLTWKPYEEHMQNFERSGYYKTNLDLYDKCKKLVGKENVRVVAHPKFTNLLAGTDLADSIWKGTISEVLSQTKLLITDYSSVCYNVFHQGGGVIFYQPDLEEYETHNGRLIPNDDEYIGHRVFTEAQLSQTLKASVSDSAVNLDVLRTSKFVKSYGSINEYHDGKNIHRLYKRLDELGLL